MVSLREINRRLTRIGDDLERKVRRVLPATKGGDSQGRTIREQIEDNLSGLAPEVTKEITGQQPIPTFTIPSAPKTGIARGFANVVRPERDIVTPMEALTEVINNPDIVVDNKLQNLINAKTVGMDPITGEIGPIEDLMLGDQRNRMSIDQDQLSRQFERQNVVPPKKRKVSKYQKEFGVQLKKLKKKHPRTAITRLMKRAHAATRKALK